MKIQCACGQKFAFEVTPEMARKPVHFVCPSCGLDSSASVAALVMEELGIAPPPPGASKPGTAPPAPPLRGTASASSSPASAPRQVAVMQGVPREVSAPAAVPSTLKIHRDTPAAAPAPEVAEGETGSHSAQRCAKHPGQFAVERCVVCSKPLCPQCMALFGYVCSPLCRAKAEAQGIDVPVFAGQKSVVEARAWRKTVYISGAAAAVIALFLGVWFWYAWFGSQPSVAFSIHFDDRAYSGASAIAGENQLVFLHGGLLARYDMKTKKQIWSRDLIDKAEIDKEVEKTMTEMKAIVDKANSDDPDFAPKMPDPAKLRQDLVRDAAAALGLQVAGKNIWVSSPDKLTEYDWDTGAPGKTLPITSRFASVLRRGDELLLVDDERGERTITHIDLNTSSTRTEEINGTTQPEVAAAEKNSGAEAAGSARRPGAGLPIGTPGRDSDKALDPKKVAEQAQHLSLPAKIALPAVLANNRSQERTLKELKEDSGAPKRGAVQKAPDENAEMIPTRAGFIQMTVKLLEHKEVARSAMKAAPSKRIMDGNLKASQSLDAANEILNDMQRERGGDIVMEDQSRYLVKIRHPGTSDDWSAEVVGAPRIFPLQTVTIVTAGKLLFAIDKQNHKLWQATLAYEVPGGYRDPDEVDPRYGQGPCVEHDKVLYVFDEGVLTCFEIANGNVRWRVPSVGISGLYFDDKGDLYLNTTDASPDSIKYSRQIDVTQRTGTVVMKVDAKTGKTLWTARPGGQISYISGKFIYSVESYSPMDEDAPVIAGLETLPHVRIKRIDPGNGKVLWEYYQDRAPLDVEFDKNVIRLVFKKEIQVVKYLAL